MKLTIEKLAEKIEADNEAFNNMSKAKKRVQISRDCLDRMELKQFTPITGQTCIMNVHFKQVNWDISIKDILSKRKLPDCLACAKGGLFLSYIGRTNKFNFSQIENTSKLDSPEMVKLLEIFEALQLDGIEAAFEQEIINDNSVVNQEDRNFLEMCSYYRDGIKPFNYEDLLKSICKNIIKNNGEFIPTDYVSPSAKIK